MWENRSGEDFESGEARHTVLILRTEEEHGIFRPFLLSLSCTRPSAGKGSNVEAPTDKTPTKAQADDQEKGDVTKWRVFFFFFF